MGVSSSRSWLTGAALRAIIAAAAVLVMSNLSALVDAVLHPEIPYFDREHLVVGGVTGLATVAMLALAALYTRNLERALRTIRTLEEFLSVCSHCRRVRVPGSDPAREESWQPLEAYVAQHAGTEFSHGICPRCLDIHYPEFSPADRERLRDRPAPAEGQPDRR